MFFFLCLEHTDSADKCLINKQITEKAASEHIKPFAQGLQSHLSSLGQLHTAVFHHIQSCKIKFPLTRPITITPCRLSAFSDIFKLDGSVVEPHKQGFRERVGCALCNFCLEVKGTTLTMDG